MPKRREEILVLLPWCIRGREWPFAGLCRRQYICDDCVAESDWPEHHQGSISAKLPPFL